MALEKKGQESAASNFSANEEKLPAKPYLKPRVQTLVINSKNDVMGTSCFTSTNASSKANGCPKSGVKVCFS